MKVYAVLIGWNCENYSSPGGIFSSLELAVEHAKTYLGQYVDCIEVFEYEVDLGVADPLWTVPTAVIK